jgi:hypothetical protein
MACSYSCSQDTGDETQRPRIFLVVLFIGLVGVILAVVLIAVALRIVPAKGADRPFDWDRYYARQDACLEADRRAGPPGPSGKTSATSWPYARPSASARPSGHWASGGHDP